MPKVEQVRDHLVLLVSGQGSQLFFDFLNTHQMELKGFESRVQARPLVAPPNAECSCAVPMTPSKTNRGLPASAAATGSEVWKSRSKFSNKGYHKNGQHPNEPYRSEAKQGEKGSHASGLE
jgi:hypothetical protein